MVAAVYNGGAAVSHKLDDIGECGILRLHEKDILNPHPISDSFHPIRQPAKFSISMEPAS